MRSGTSKRWLTSALGLTLVLSACPSTKTQIHGTHEDPPGRPVRQMGLLTKDFGWALTEGRFAITTDFGKTWRDQTPIDIPSGELRGAFVLDTKHAWLAGRAPDGGVVVYRTDALGEGWRASTIKGSFGDPKSISMSFVDSAHGWVDIPTDATTDRAELHKTTDGGATWTKLSLPSGEGSRMSFTTPSVGSLVAGTARDRLFETRDAGASWSRVTPPGMAFGSCGPLTAKPQRCPQPSAPAFALPVFTNKIGRLAVTYSRSRPSIGFYNWIGAWDPVSLTSLRAKPESGELVASAALGETTLYYDPPSLVKDPRHGPLERIEAHGLPPTLDALLFVDAAHGWAVGKEPDRHLLTTSDGGANWLKLFP